MKKTILALGLILVLASCGGAAKEEATKTDSTAVAVDTLGKCVSDSSAAVDTTAVK